MWVLALVAVPIVSPVAQAVGSAGTGELDPLSGSGIVLHEMGIDVRVTDAIARTRLSLVFENTAAVHRNATVDVPLPAGATLTGFNLTVGNRTHRGRVLPHDQAQQEYQDAVDQGRQAVLLESPGRDRVRLRVHVGPAAEPVLRLAYVEHLPLRQGARTYQLGLPPGDGPTPAEVEARIEVRSRADIMGMAAPGFDLDVVERSLGRVVLEGNGSAGDAEALRVRWTEGDEAWAASLTGAAPDGRWTPVLATAAFRPAEAAGTLPRDIVFVLDTSGSMAGAKVRQARDSVREVLLELRPDDRFGIVGFDSRVRQVSDGLVPVSDASVSTHRERLSDVSAGGSTDVDAALQHALQLLGDAGAPERVPVIVLVTDGKPTHGVTEPSRIVSRTVQANDREAAVHPIAIGLDARDGFLEDLARTSGGELLELAPGTDLEERLAGYYASLSDPLLTDVRVEISGVPHDRVLPETLPTLYRDDTLRVAFRANLSAGDNVTMTVSGQSPGGPLERTFRFDVGGMPVEPAVARIWGKMHVDRLMTEDRVGERDLRDAIVANATRYGIVTPYTSWIAVEDPSATVEDPDDATDPGDTVDDPVPDPDAIDPPAPHAVREQAAPAAGQGTADRSATGGGASTPTPGSPAPHGSSGPADAGRSSGPASDAPTARPTIPGPGLALAVLAGIAALTIKRRG